MFKVSFAGDPNIGLYGFATDKYYLAGFQRGAPKTFETLKVPVVSAMVMNTYFAGMFAAGNSRGIIISNFSAAYGFTKIKHSHVLELETNQTALGNLIIANDIGAIISPLLRKSKDTIEEFLGVKTEIGTVAGLKICGSAAIATNKGCLAHPKIKESEKAVIEKVLEVPVMIGTVNYGSPYVKSGIIANSFSFAVSEQSTGPEMGNIVEALGFLE
ncbi:MAG: translation initiation factor IF-6 [Candidatus Aenigmarchaeota archaeon]|nr:translation initiation factor IF-6 [Candidatus Aenigmarchaeota archaeon]